MAKNGKKHAPTPAGDKPKARYALSLSVENVRCFGPKQTLDLSDGHGRPAQWTIILGENGTGKTTLLQLLVGFEEIVWNWNRAPENARPEDYDPRFFVAFWNDSHWLRDSLPELIEGECELQYTEMTSELGSFAQKRCTASISMMRHGGGGWHSEESPPNFVAYGASRRLGQPPLADSERDDPVASLFSDIAPLRNAEDWLIRLDYSAEKVGESQHLQRRRRTRIAELLTSGLLPDITNLRFVSPIGPNPKPRVEFQTPFGWVPLRQLGYGYQTLIAWMLDFVSRMVERYPDSPDPLKEPAICVVDEIDLHLHPAWQRKLIGFLSERFPNTQFIATAHSPLVVQAAENANIAVLRREGDHVVIDNDVDNIRNWRVDQILTSDLFGLESARSPEVEKLMARNEELIAKPKLTAAEKRELKEVQQKIEELPTWADPGEKRDLETIKTILQRLDRSSPK